MNKPGKPESGNSTLSDQQRFAEVLLRIIPGMAYRCENDRPWTMTYVSDGCEALTGYGSADVVNMRLGWADFVHSEDKDAARTTVESALGAHQPFDIQYRIIDRFGKEKWVREQGCGIYNETGSVEAIEGYIDDVTPLKSAIQKLADAEANYEEEVRQRHERLAHADRLHTLGEMASGIAHEINQPLAAISLFAQTGKRLLGARDFEKLQEVFDKLSQHAYRAGAIIERMQDMARHNRNVLHVVDLNALIEEVVDLAEIDARRSSIVIEFDPQNDLPKVKADVVQIQQVTLNLLRNGMDAMRSTGCHHGNAIQLTTRKLEDGFLEVAVKDSGHGVSEEVAERLFDSFSTTKPAGLGMGLPISKAIVTAHGGELAFRNNDISGATFWFTLPVATRGVQDG